MPARARIGWLADPGSFVEEAADVRSDDPLHFFDLRPYGERLAEAELNTGLTDAMVIGHATMDGHPVELAVMDFSFMGGSMGSAVGEKFSRACDSAIDNGRAADRRLELRRRAHAGGDLLADAAAEDGRGRRGPARRGRCRCSSCSRTRRPAARSRASRRSATSRSPSPARCSRSPGPRVVEGITREKLPDDFARAESNLRYGHIDAIVPRPEQRPYLTRLLRLFER